MKHILNYASVTNSLSAENLHTVCIPVWLQCGKEHRNPLYWKIVFIRTLDASDQFVLIYEGSLNGLMG